jgi:hypothetical protein
VCNFWLFVTGSFGWIQDRGIFLVFHKNSKICGRLKDALFRMRLLACARRAIVATSVRVRAIREPTRLFVSRYLCSSHTLRLAPTTTTSKQQQRRWPAHFR